MLHAIPGDPVLLIAGEHAPQETIDAITQRLGLDRPLHVQFFSFLSGAVRGDLGRSIITNRNISQEIASRFPLTFKVAFLAVLLQIVIGLALGIAAALSHRKLLDNVAMFVALLGISTPSFWLALLLMLLFGVTLNLLPISGYHDWRSLIMPALTLGLFTGAGIARMTRSTVLEILNQDYVRTARAKGLGEQVVIGRHVLKNALIPIVTLVGMSFGALLGGAIITETVFALPGIAQLAINAINRRDFPMVQGVVLVIAVTFTLCNLVVDIIYSILDPRIRYD